MKKFLLILTTALVISAGPAFSQQAIPPGSGPGDGKIVPGVYNIEVVSVRGTLMSIRVEGEPGRRHYRLPPDFTFDIDGQDVNYTELQPKQKLRAYVTEEMIAPHDYAAEDTTIIIAVVTDPPEEEEVVEVVMMPSTAGFLPLAGLAGLLLLGLGFVARRLRM